MALVNPPTLTLLAILPVLALAACILACRARRSYWREAILGGAVAWGVVAVALTEGLSAFHALTAVVVAFAWATVIACALAPLALRKYSRMRSGSSSELARRRVWPVPRQTDAVSLAFYLPLGLILVVLGGLTVSSAPNTWDSMTYHLARLIHWQASASLAPYPTHILRQLYLQPGAEFVLLHLQLLSGTDRFDGLVQWAAMVGALIGVALIAAYLGARQGGVVCGVCVAASIPIGILEGTSTQNDYVVTFWLVCLVVFGLRLLRAERADISWPIAAAFGASLGLALLTKATAYLFALPFVIWMAVAVLKRRGARALAPLTAAGALAFALNAGFYARNVAVFDSPLGPPDEGSSALRYFNDALTPQLFASNVLRDLGVNLVATPLVAVNVRSFNVVRALHTYMGVDIQDPRTTWGGEHFAEQRVERAFDENFAGNPIHLFLTIGAVAAVLLLRKRLWAPVLPYAISLVAGFLLLAAILRWQPWVSRLELPLFVLGAPLVGVVAERFAPRLTLGLAGVLLVSMLPWVINNQARPLIGPSSVFRTSRADQYFVFQADVEQPYLGAVANLASRGCDQIGFISNQDGWEYPVTALLPASARIEHVSVSNVSAGLDSAFTPCAVLALSPAFSHAPLRIGATTYAPGWSDADVSVLTPEGQ